MGNFQPICKRSFGAATGFTILELLISTSIIAILSSIAIPSFAAIISNGRISSTSAELFTTLMLSRNYAATTSSTVIVCHARDSSMTRCSESRERNTNWSNGIISYADLNRNDTLDENDRIISTLQTDSKVAIVFNQNGRLRFFSNGSARSAGFYLCSTASSSERHLRILYTGRTRTVTEMNENQRNTCLSTVF